MDRYREALDRFRKLLDDAKQTDLAEPTAVTVATADATGRPSARTVLLKDFDERGFVFFTNHNSRKGRQLSVNPRAALCFFWQPLQRQVLIEGKIEQVSEKESDEYWSTRSRFSQIGAWASRQSSPLPSRFALLRRVVRLGARYATGTVPRPPFWGGFRLVPERIEFWTNKPHRLHERLLYQKESGDWTVSLLYP